MSSISNSFVATKNHPLLLRFSPESPLDKHFHAAVPPNLSFTLNHPRKLRGSSLAVQAAYSDDGGRTSSGSLFVGGFVLGGLIVGALGCVYAPQISRVLAGTEGKDLMRKLPKFIYDEDKALEKTRQVLAEKIAQLNSAIDDVSSQLRPDSEDAEDGVNKNSDEVEAAT